MITNKNELATMLRTIHKAAVMEAEAKAAKAAVKEYMERNGLDTVTAGGFNASIKQVDSKRFNSAAFKSAEPALYEQFTIIDSVTRLYVK